MWKKTHETQLNGLARCVHPVTHLAFLREMYMKLKTLALAILALSATAAQADVSGSFGSSSSLGGTFFASDAGLLSGSVLSSFTGLSGYNITSVTVDGIAIVDLLPGLDDYYFFSTPVAAGAHNISVTGLSYGGSFVGSYSVTSVPEPESFALALAGLGIAGGLARRRLS